jgi:hypothetical protein
MQQDNAYIDINLFNTQPTKGNKMAKTKTPMKYPAKKPMPMKGKGKKC